MRFPSDDFTAAYSTESSSAVFPSLPIPVTVFLKTVSSRAGIAMTMAMRIEKIRLRRRREDIMVEVSRWDICFDWVDGRLCFVVVGVGGFDVVGRGVIGGLRYDEEKGK
jgi:hypothetical protein